MTKICFKCKKELPLTSEFFHVNSRNKDGFYGTCRECRNSYRAKWRKNYKEKNGVSADKKYQQENGEKFAQWRAARVFKNAQYVTRLKEKTPCADCGKLYPAVCMDFDHISDDKDAGITQMINGGYSIERIKKEIDKCELVCANDHRIRTANRPKPWTEELRIYDRSTWFGKTKKTQQQNGFNSQGSW